MFCKLGAIRAWKALLGMRITELYSKKIKTFLTKNEKFKPVFTNNQNILTKLSTTDTIVALNYLLSSAVFCLSVSEFEFYSSIAGVHISDVLSKGSSIFSSENSSKLGFHKQIYKQNYKLYLLQLTEIL